MDQPKPDVASFPTQFLKFAAALKENHPELKVDTIGGEPSSPRVALHIGDRWSYVWRKDGLFEGPAIRV